MATATETHETRESFLVLRPMPLDPGPTPPLDGTPSTEKSNASSGESTAASASTEISKNKQSQHLQGRPGLTVETSQAAMGNHSGKRDPISVSSVCSAVFSPRPYEAIYSERAYLAGNLEIQSAKSANLLQQYASLDARLQDGVPAGERRRWRKRMSLLRCQIKEASEQEKAVMYRLGELYVELNSRNSWSQFHQHEESVQTSSAPLTASPNSSCSTQYHTPLSPGLHHAYTFEHEADLIKPAGLNAYPRTGLDAIEESGEVVAVQYEEATGAASEQASEGRRELEYEYRILSSQSPEVATDTCTFSAAQTEIKRDKRWSLPCLGSIWPED